MLLCGMGGNTWATSLPPSLLDEGFELSSENERSRAVLETSELPGTQQVVHPLRFRAEEGGALGNVHIRTALLWSESFEHKRRDVLDEFVDDLLGELKTKVHEFSASPNPKGGEERVIVSSVCPLSTRTKD